MSISTVSLQPRTALRAAGVIALVSIVANLVAYVIARGLGTDFDVTRPDGATMTVSAPVVILTTLVPLVLGVIALVVAARWGARGWSALAWTGLALGVLTVVMPLSTEAADGTKAGLAVMHVLTGLIWFVIVRQTARRSD